MTTLLLDTHVFLWMQTTPDRLGASRDLIEDSATRLLLSAASSWEISIKWSLGKLVLPDSPQRFVPDRMRRSAVEALPIEHSHALAVSALAPLHNDPFDRLLVAQATVEKLSIATADPAVRAYGVAIEWLGS